jgi:hypothetical protein
MTYHPTSDLVAVSWLRQLPSVLAGVATELPRDTATWAEHGFIQVGTVGGTPDMYLPIAQPALSVDCWAVGSGSGKPPWNKANQLAEQIRAATYNQDAVDNLLVTLPAAYNNARVFNAYLLTEPRRIFDDEGSYARYQFDLQLHWVEVPA